MKPARQARDWLFIRIRSLRQEVGHLRQEVGQTTAEYALVLLGAAAVAIVLINWAGSDDNGIKEFFQRIMEKLQSKVE